MASPFLREKEERIVLLFPIKGRYLEKTLVGVTSPEVQTERPDLIRTKNKLDRTKEELPNVRRNLFDFPVYLADGQIPPHSNIAYTRISERRRRGGGQGPAEAPPTTLPVCLLVHREGKKKGGLSVSGRKSSFKASSAKRKEDQLLWSKCPRPQKNSSRLLDRRILFCLLVQNSHPQLFSFMQVHLFHRKSKNEKQNKTKKAGKKVQSAVEILRNKKNL